MATPGTINGEHARRLYTVAQALTAALTPADVAKVAFERALVDLGASTAGFWLLEEGVIRFAGGAGHGETIPSQVGSIPLDSDLPAAVAVRNRQVVAYGSQAERNERWPALAGIAQAAEAVIVLPMTVKARTLGCIHIGYPTAIPVENMELPLLERLAELCAAALDRAQLYEQERIQREQLEFFSDATRVLISSLDPVEVVRALVDIAVPRLAEWCAVLTPQGDHLVTVSLRVAGGGSEQAELVTRETFPIAGESLVARCFRTGRPQIADPIPQAVLDRVGPQTKGALDRAEIRAALEVPIAWAGRPIGVLTLGFSEPGRASDKRLRQMAEGLALRAGVAIHNAAMYDAERTVARTLTEALLPGTTPDIEGYECSVAYLPAAGDVAGDWYDILDLGGRFLVGVGDAAGHGIPAATLMAELRNAARGLAAAGHSPSEILDSLAALADDEDQESFATAVYGVLDPGAHRLTWSSAGHPAPILVRGGVPAALPPPGDGTRLGLPIAPLGRRSRPQQELDLGPGDTLVLFTDGVVERRGASLERGIARLSDLLADAAGEPAPVVADRIVYELCSDATDDCCIVVLRRT